MTSTAELVREPAKRTVVMAPGVQLDEATRRALTELRDQQEARLVAYNDTQMAVRRAIKAARPPAPPPDKNYPKSAEVDVSKLSALVRRTDLPVLGDWQSTARLSPGEFSHVVTDLRQEGGLRAENMSDGTHFWGDGNYGGDDPIFFSVGATSHYVLPPDRIPDSPSGRWVSAPPGEAHGRIVGMHGEYHPIWHADTKVCSCKRIFRHALWQLVNNQWHMLGERFLEALVIRVRNVEGDSFREHNSPGYLGTPDFAFGVVDRSQPVWAQVEIRFEVELEGPYAWISFGTNPSNGVVVRTFGWWARPV